MGRVRACARSRAFMCSPCYDPIRRVQNVKEPAHLGYHVRSKIDIRGEDLKLLLQADWLSTGKVVLADT
jgi:hypothetical protein